MIQFKRALQDKTRLGHGTLGGVDEQQHAVDHFQDTLDFARKIGVTGCVDDVDLFVFIMYGGVFSQNRNAAFALEVVRVHDTLGRHLVLAVDTPLLEHFVNQRGFTVVNVRDDCYVA